MHSDFEIYGRAVGLSSCCLYGGSPFRAQVMSIRAGVDIVVGTPGRVKVFSFFYSFISIFFLSQYFFFLKKIICLFFTGSHTEKYS